MYNAGNYTILSEQTMALDNTLNFYMSDTTKLATVFIPSDAHPDQIVACLKQVANKEKDHMICGRLNWDILASKMISTLLSQFTNAKLVPGDGIATKYRNFAMDIIPNNNYETQKKSLIQSIDISASKIVNNGTDDCLYEGELSSYHPKYTTEAIEFKAYCGDINGFLASGTVEIGLRMMNPEEVSSAFEQGKYILVDNIHGLFSNELAGVKFLMDRELMVLQSGNLDLKDEVYKSSEFTMIDQKPYHPKIK